MVALTYFASVMVKSYVIMIKSDILVNLVKVCMDTTPVHTTE